MFCVRHGAHSERREERGRERGKERGGERERGRGRENRESKTVNSLVENSREVAEFATRVKAEMTEMHFLLPRSFLCAAFISFENSI